MAPLPKRKLSHARQGDSRAHLHLKLTTVSPCPQCGNLRLPHRACPSCGTYRGRQVLKVKEKEARQS